MEKSGHSSVANFRSVKCGRPSSPLPKHRVPWAGMSTPRQPGPCQGSWGARPRLQGAGLLVSGTWAQNQPVGGLCHGQWRGKEQRRAQLDHPSSSSTSDLPSRLSLPLDILLEPRDLGLWTFPYKPSESGQKKSLPNGEQAILTQSHLWASGGGGRDCRWMAGHSTPPSSSRLGLGGAAAL